MSSRARPSWRHALIAAGFAAFGPGKATALDGATREWRFDVALDGRHIGEHRFVLREAGSTRLLTSEARFRVRVLFFDVYRYEHHAQERWRANCLERLDARTDDNGLHTAVVEDIAASRGCVRTFAYWNPDFLAAHELLNPQTGEYVAVQVRELGREQVGGQPAQRYHLTGGGRTPVEIDLWYSPAGEWLALESRTPEGRRLRYSRQ